MTRPIRVLHLVSGDLWAGAEVQAFTLMSHLARASDTQVYAALLNEGTLAARLRAVRVPVKILDERQIGTMGILLGLRRLMKACVPDVIHTHRTKENILGSVANRMWCAVPCVRSVHGSDEQATLRGIARARRRMLCGLDAWCGRNLQHRIIAVSEQLGQQLIPRFAPTPVLVIENGIDSDAVRAARRAAEFRAATPQAMHVGIVGRLVPVKRVDLFVETASLLRRVPLGHTWRFHVFGDGPLRAALEAQTEQLDLSDCITFHGYRDDIATCIGGLDILVNCSDHEGLPMTCLEAVALGVPIAAHAVGGLQSVLPKEHLVFRHDPEGYRDAILKLLHNSASLRIYEGRALERFSAARNAMRVRALYQELTRERAQMMEEKW